MGSPKSQISVVPAAVLALLLPAAAVAATPPPPPPDTPSISQYVEQVPTSRGGSSPGVGKAQARALPADVTARLHSHSDAVSKQLEKVATSSTYGAPQRVLPKPARGSVEPRSSNALSAAVSAVSDSGDSHIVWLLLAVLLVTIAIVLASARRRPS